MKVITLNKDWSIVCEHQNTRNGFRHIAIIMHSGIEVGRTKCTYLNRTWEAYEFESVALKSIDIIKTFTGYNSISKNLATRFRKKIKF